MERTSSGGTGVTMSFIRTRSNSDSVAFNEPSGRPNGKQYLRKQKKYYR